MMNCAHCHEVMDIMWTAHKGDRPCDVSRDMKQNAEAILGCYCY